jgi:hypothetical protein
MPLLRKGPYAPRRQTVRIDWAKERAAADQARREEAAAQEAALRSIREFHADGDPWSQIVKRCQGIEDQFTALRRVVERQGAQIDTLIDSEEARNNA